jgi:hypothetical protein
MPQVGEFMPGVWLLSGFGAQGIATSATGAEIIGRAILDGGQTWRLFQPFDLVWAGGRLGRMAAQTAYWHARTRERVAAFMARRAHPIQLPEIEPEPVPTADDAVETQTKPKRRRRKTAAEASDPAPAG